MHYLLSLYLLLFTYLLLLLLFRIHLLLLLVLLICNININIFLHCAPLSKRKEGKRLDYLRFGNNMLNHGYVSVFDRA